ncbi:hypothetical protein ACIAD1573 [Acinetobacter baylyi ADP1]|uniref:Uncharacterized protein n=1 Tax=Acinetobacter baylyi (strain ATCC 33305 / BD413 / ADP1) TaxID=62977 RepID=Q6FBY8_ACIAD|nr:hypothetical protein ACIAD1573 [Acinetobacter baylyi ADP1]
MHNLTAKFALSCAFKRPKHQINHHSSGNNENAYPCYSLSGSVTANTIIRLAYCHEVIVIYDP